MNTNDFNWVELETSNGTNQTRTFRGKIEHEVFNAIINGSYTKEFLKLSHTYWFSHVIPETGQPFYRKHGEKNYPEYFDFSGIMYHRVKDIVSICLLKGHESEMVFPSSESSH
jgi:hypothetical protein